MKEHQDRLLQIPLGTESFFLEEAYRHREITYKLHRLFTSWGYLPVETPVFDFFDTYRNLLSGNKKQIYRLIDREGDLLMLRSDITLFLAKQMGLILRDEDLPARVSYGDTILRHQNREDISSNEFFQSGAELIGVEGIEGDLEILMLMIETFETLGLSPAIHFGSRKLVDTVFSQLSGSDRQSAIEEVRNRERGKIIKRLSALYPEREAERLDQVLHFIGDREHFEELKSSLKASPGSITGSINSDVIGILMDETFNWTSAVLDNLRELGKDELFQVDFSEVGEQPYYTGLVFQAYLPQLDSAIASGGRYDKLLSSFGLDAPSVGFSMMQRKVEPLAVESFSPPKESGSEKRGKFVENFKEAQRKRASGKIVTL